MEERRLAVRILGVASTTHGFAFCVTEGPVRLLDWGRTNVLLEREVRAKLRQLVTSSRPLFVACEIGRKSKNGIRARVLNHALKAVCKERGIMILCVGRHTVDRPARGGR